MRRILLVLLGMLIGIVISVPLTATADSLTELVGKKVQRTVAIWMNGEQVADAVIINNRTYAPVRAVAEMLGASAAYIDGEVVITPKGGADMSEDEAALNQVEEDERIEERNALRRSISALKDELMVAQKQLDSARYSYNWAADMIERINEAGLPDDEKSQGIQKYTEYHAELENEIASLEAEINEKQRQLAELETQLAELEAE